MLRAKPLIVLAFVGLMAAACGGSSPKTKIAGLSANDKGTKDVSAGGSAEIEADTYYFNPSVLKGKPGERLTLQVKNGSSGTQHNFTLKSQQINKDIPSGKSVTVTVTFPQSGVLSFYCEYHKDRGMAGALLTSGSLSG